MHDPHTKRTSGGRPTQKYNVSPYVFVLSSDNSAEVVMDNPYLREIIELQELVAEQRQNIRVLQQLQEKDRREIEDLSADLGKCHRFLGLIAPSRIKITQEFWRDAPNVRGTVGIDPETGCWVVILR